MGLPRSVIRSELWRVRPCPQLWGTRAIAAGPGSYAAIVLALPLTHEVSQSVRECTGQRRSQWRLRSPPTGPRTLWITCCSLRPVSAVVRPASVLTPVRAVTKMCLSSSLERSTHLSKLASHRCATADSWCGGAACTRSRDASHPPSAM